MTKNNGSGKHDEKVVRLPTLAERDRMRKAREKVENQNTRKPVPFFNFSKIPPFTGGLILTFVAVHIYLHFFLDPETLYNVFNTFGFRPAAFMTPGALSWPVLLSPVAHLFIHGGWTHLFFNSVTALVMCMFFEREFGAKTTAFFFFACGLAGAVFYFAFFPFSETPVIGASAGLSGLFGAVMILLFQRRPQAQRLKYGPWPLIIFWVIFMVTMGSFGGETLAWQAHVGGFLAGIGLLHLLQKRKA